MNADTLNALNAVQQVLRHLTIALGAAGGVDFGNLSRALHAGATNPELDPIAQRMLADLAAGTLGLAGMGDRKQ